MVLAYTAKRADGTIAFEFANFLEGAMPSITIRSGVSDDQIFFQAVTGSQKSSGRTGGEALDSLLAQEGESIDSSSIVIHRFSPDVFFSQAQHNRLRFLADRQVPLSEEESKELDALLDAELDATVDRLEQISELKSA